MNEITAPDAPVSYGVMESVLGTGDLSKLTPQQRVEYYMKVCQTVGLNPLTRPFRFMSFQGNTVLYATRDCADQLRQTRKIDLTIVDKQMDGDLYIVTARAKTPDGRHDEDMGAVAIGHLKGEARANGILKAITKAKRRVTLSVCGLGFLDETEVETLAGAITYDAEVPTQPHPILNPEPYSLEEMPTNNRIWLANVQGRLESASTTAEVAKVEAIMSVKEARKNAPTVIRGIIEDAIRDAYARLAAITDTASEADNEAAEAQHWAETQEKAQ